MQISRDKHGNYILDQSIHAKNLVGKHLGEISSGKRVNRPLPIDFIATKKVHQKQNRNQKSWV